MPLARGTRLGAYEIESMLGAGGMGEVYRATDVRLERSVAIKVLPAEFSADDDRRRRLEREAKSIAGLTHPNICALYDVGHEGGADFLVMELVEGETLAERIARGPVPLDQLFRYGAEIARALDAAHRRGLVHRDLKPGNVMISRTGTKLLDFGLAKLAVAAARTGESATIRQPVTEEGKIVGTLQYMAPEQLEGKDADARTDIFALGCVLYEMATGKRAFSGSSHASLIAAIMHEQPVAVASVRPVVPAGLQRVIEKCLAKDPETRWQSARDLADEMEWLAAGRTAEAAPAGRRWVVIASAIALAAVALAAFAWLKRPAAPARQGAFRFSLALPDQTTMLQRATRTEIAVSPDGRSIAFVGADRSRTRLWVQSLDSLTARPLEGTEDAAGPFWDEEGKRIGFFSGGRLKIVNADGGPVTVVGDASGGGGSWRGRRILFGEWGPATTENIKVISEDGSGLKEFRNDLQGWQYWPVFLPDGEHYLFYLNRLAPGNGIYVGSLSGGKPERILETRGRVEVSSDWKIFYVRSGALVRQSLDRRSLKVTGEPEVLIDSVYHFDSTGVANFSVSADGSVIAFERASVPTKLQWVDRDGRARTPGGQPRLYRNFRLSPDGTRVATDIINPETGASDVWIQDLSRDVLTRVTSSQPGAFAPIWSHDGKSLFYAAGDPLNPTQPPQITERLLGGGERRLMEKDGPEYPTDLTADGRWIVYSINRGRQYDIELLSVREPGRKQPLIATDYSESDATLAPDGRSIAFASDESGQPEIYVRPFMREGEKVRVSTAGGTEPRWSRDSREVYYLAPDRMLMAAAVRSDGAVGETSALFRISSAGMLEFEDFRGSHYQVGSDGRSFLVRSLEGDRDRDPITVLVNR